MGKYINDVSQWHIIGIREDGRSINVIASRLTRPGIDDYMNEPSLIRSRIGELGGGEDDVWVLLLYHGPDPTTLKTLSIDVSTFYGLYSMATGVIRV